MTQVPSAGFGAHIRRRAQRAHVADRMLTKSWLVRTFLALHGTALVVLLPQIAVGRAIGDLPLYRDWAMAAFGGQGVIGLEADWVYPLLAWLPIGAANLLGARLYLLLWFAMTAGLNWWALWVVSDGARSRHGMLAGYTAMLGFLLLSPVALLRLEGITGPLVVIALVWLTRRPLVSGALLAVATWIKVWPALVIGAIIAVRRERWPIIAAGVAVTAATATISAASGGLAHLFSFLTTQSDRALQLEAPIATPWVWMASVDFLGAHVYQNHELATREVVGPLDGAAIVLSTPVLIAAVLAIAGLVLWARRRGALDLDLLLVGSLALVAAAIVCNKVGSPQYMLWLLPIVVVGMRTPTQWWRRMTGGLLIIALLTTLIFPIFYLPLVRLEFFPVMLLTVRNALLVVLLAAAVVRLVHLGRRIPASRDGEVPTTTRPVTIV